MFVRTLLSRDFLVSAVIVALAGGYFTYLLFDYKGELELLRNPQDRISLTQDKLDDIAFDRRHVVAITDFDFLGEPFVKGDFNYQVLSANGIACEPKKETLLVAYSSNLAGDALREMIAASKGGNWYPVQGSNSELTDLSSTENSDSESTDELVHPDYPELNLSGVNKVGFKNIETFARTVPLFGTIVGGHVLYLIFAFFFIMKALKKRAEWELKLEGFDPEVFNQYPRALRLCGIGSPGLPSRRVDPDYDVAQKSKIKSPKLKRWGWKIGAALAILTIGTTFQHGTSYGLEGLIQNRYAQIGMAMVFMFGIHMAVFLAQGVKVGGMLEEPIKPGSLFARYQKLPFFKYHNHVLKSLGMIELGAFKQTGGHVCMVRTIYLSPNGNVLVEVGVEGKEFFTIQSVINSGKFLETHSKATPRLIKADLLKRHQRRSASHEDILQALEDHDHFVAEFAGSGFNEAQFDEEKFPRFLEWGGEKNAS